MSCGGSLTGSLLTAAGGLVTNGAAAGVFGGAPLSSLSSVPISVTDAITGETLAPTLATLTSGFSDISGQSWYSSLSTSLSAMNASANFTSTMTDAWNSIGSGLSDTGFFDAVGGFAADFNDTLSTVTTGINQNINEAVGWAGKTIGGAGELVGGVLTGDGKKFGSILGSAQGLVAEANSMINAATNSGFLGDTFTSMNDIVTGGLSGVNLDFGGFGQEIAKLGGTVNLSNIANLGSPGQMLSNLADAGSLGPLYNKIASIPLDSRTLQSLGQNVASGTTATLASLGVDITTIAREGANLPPALQQAVYSEFESLSTTEVAQVKSILGNTVDAVVDGADLFNPTKLFPETYDTLTAPFRTASVGSRAIYTDNSGSVNPIFDELGEPLKGIIPDDLAVANGALAQSLEQIKNIQQSNTLQLGTETANLETLKDLDLINNQTSYVSQAVVDYWTDTYTTSGNVTLGTGQNGQLVLSDVIGFAAGYNSAAPFNQNKALFQAMQDAGDLDVFTQAKGVYDTIDEFVAGTFGPTNVPPWTVTITAGYVGEGSYTGATEAEARENAFINGIIPAVKTICEGFANNTNAQTIIRNSKRWNEQLAREYLNQVRIDNQDLGATRASDDTAIALANELPNLGQDTTAGGSAELLERIVDFSSVGGQSIIAAMRQGRNIARLETANIQQDGAISQTGESSPGTLLSGQYTKAETQDQLIKN